MAEKHPLVGDNALRELKELAKFIQNSLRKTTVEKIKVGGWLLQARQLLASDNEFGDWCKKNFPGLNRHTRQNYMNLAKVFGGELFNTIEFLSDTALYLLARPGMPKIIQDYFIQRAQANESVKVSDIKDAKARYSEVEDRDKELFDTLSNQSFEKFDTSTLDRRRGGSQAERIRAAQNGMCVLAYPFDHKLIAWATENKRLLFAPNESINDERKKPFYNFWLYRNNDPSTRMLFDNYWRRTRSPVSAFEAYEMAINRDGNDLKKYAPKLRGYVLSSATVDAYWHAPLIAKLVNGCQKSINAEAELHSSRFWMFKSVDTSAFTVDEVAERLRLELEARGDKEEIRRFIGLLQAMNLVAPSIKSYLYRK